MVLVKSLRLLKILYVIETVGIIPLNTSVYFEEVRFLGPLY
jgi:hypothetical protein